jgi:hypothetical protein
MSMSLSLLTRTQPVRARRARTHRYALTVEGLEERTVLSTFAALPHPHAYVARPAVTSAPPNLSISGITVQGVSLNGNNLVANATLNGAMFGLPFHEPISIPLTITPSAATSASNPVQVLNLSIGAVNLSLLGLNIHLGGNCTFGSTTPITAKIVAIPSGSTYTFGGTTYQGGLLGSLVADVANLLNGGTGLSGLTTSQLGVLDSGLTGVLNQVLGGLSGATASTSGPPATPATTTHEVLELPLGPLNVDLLGLYVHTSFICLNITATPGPGNLLGNLL